MTIIKRNRKLRMLICVTMIIALLLSNIAPAAAMAAEMSKSQAIWEDILNADLSAYEGARFPLNLDESNPVDTGVDTKHPDLTGKLIDDYDFVNNIANVNSEEWYHDQGHGASI
ncbi:MAG: hypothetical protein FWG43_05080 [Clostridiales bacterium]|nr:hypothetical protein [Clostridiales bacterium]